MTTRFCITDTQKPLTGSSHVTSLPTAPLGVYRATRGLPHWLEVKNPPASAGDSDLIPGSERSPGEGNGNPLQCSGECHGQRSQAGYSPWGCKRVRQDLVTEQQQCVCSIRYLLCAEPTLGFSQAQEACPVQVLAPAEPEVL